MNDLQTIHSGHKDWEDWDSDGDEEAYEGHDEQTVHHNEPLPLSTIEESPDSPLILKSDASLSSNNISRIRTSMHTATASFQTSAARHSVQKPLRLKSRARQQAQNAKAGIRLVTDMTKLRKQQQLQQQQQQMMQQQQLQRTPIEVDARLGKFVDAAALRALEGKPSDTSVGNWNWLRRRANSNSNSQSPLKESNGSTRAPKNVSTATSEPAQDLSPNDRPIVIGISLPEDDLVGRTVSPQTATVETPVDIGLYLNKGTATHNMTQHSHLQQVSFPSELSPQMQMQSVWSPDTEEGSPHSAGVSRAASSVYSQYGHSAVASKEPSPPVPSLPSAYRDALGVGMAQTDTMSATTTAPTAATVDRKHRSARRDSLLLGGFVEDDDDYNDADTPITLFEEDGSPVSYRRTSRLARGNRGRSLATTIDTTNTDTRSGWWDHVQTPFAEYSGYPFSAKTASPVTPASAKTPLSPLAREVVMPAVPAVPVVPSMPAISHIPMATAQTATLITASPKQPSIAASVSAVSASPASRVDTDEEWWKRTAANEKGSRTEAHSSPTTSYSAPSLPLSLSNKPALGISTSIANAHAYRVTDRSPTVASSSRSAAPAQRLVTPRVMPNAGSEKAEAEPAAAAPLTARSFASNNGRDRSQATAHSSRATPSDAPPPYEPPSRPEMVVRYRAVFPPGHPLRENFPPSPGPVSPGLANTMTSQGAIHMSDVPLTPAGARSAAAAAGIPFPNRPSGALLPGSTIVASRAAAKVERTRRRHEKEDATARRVGNLWRGRGCMPSKGFVGARGGRESRKRRRLICAGIFGSLALVIMLVVVLAVVLTRKHATSSSQKSTIWLNVTGFPPIPTGITTIIGTENTENKVGCVAPTTLWSCSLPKEMQAANEPYSDNEPSFTIQIQFDNSTRKLWDVADGAIPTPSATSSGKSTAAAVTSSTQQFDSGFTPNPLPPSFQEMWFLGNTTDGIASSQKAGEPTPFYITFLTSVNASAVGPNDVVSRRRHVRDIRKRADTDTKTADVATSSSSSSSSKHTTTSSTSKSTTAARATTTIAATTTTTSTTSVSGTASDGFPSPLVNADGTGAPAAMHPFPVQQPLRLFDRGLATEHFGFYAFFTKTIYVQSIDPTGTTTLSSDGKGGSAQVDANHVVTWLQTRFLVQIWTRMDNTTQLLGAQSGTAGTNTTQPGTFPYPITITEDLHGGDVVNSQKGVFARAVNAQQQILLTGSSAIADNLEFGGTLINHAGNPTFGGADGGTGGCKCTWNNFIGLNGNTVGQ